MLDKNVVISDSSPNSLVIAGVFSFLYDAELREIRRLLEDLTVGREEMALTFIALVIGYVFRSEGGSIGAKYVRLFRVTEELGLFGFVGARS